MPEEESFAVLVRIMADYRWQCHQCHYHHLIILWMPSLHLFCKRMREMFKPSMAELGLCMYQVAIIILFHTIITIMVFVAAGHPGTGAHSRPLRSLSVPSNAFNNIVMTIMMIMKMTMKTTMVMTIATTLCRRSTQTCTPAAGFSLSSPPPSLFPYLAGSLSWWWWWWC